MFPQLPLSLCGFSGAVSPPSSIFPQPICDQQRFLHLWQTMLNNFQMQQKMRLLLCNTENILPASTSTNGEKTKFDFAHIANSIEKEEKDKINQSPDISIPAAMGFPTYGMAPWCLLPGHARATARARRPKKEFICRHCSRQFNKSYNLQIHERTHTDERPYECEICNKKFRRQDHLRDHRYIHAKEKPFKCDECGKGFCQARTLQTHRETHNRDSVGSPSTSTTTASPTVALSPAHFTSP